MKVYFDDIFKKRCYTSGLYLLPLWSAEYAVGIVAILANAIELYGILPVASHVLLCTVNTVKFSLITLHYITGTLTLVMVQMVDWSNSRCLPCMFCCCMGAVMMTSCVITLGGGSYTITLVVEYGDIYSMGAS